MKSKKLFSQIFVAYLALTSIVILFFAVFEQNTLKNFFFDEVKSDMLARAQLIKNRLLSVPLSHNAAIDSLSKQLSNLGNVRITVILLNGTVITDSHKSALQMDNHADRPEVKTALLNRTGQSIRYSYTLKKDLIYLAIPMYKKQQLAAVVRVAFPLSSYQTSISSLRHHVLLAALLALFLGILLSYYISYRISKPIESIKKGAERFASGHFKPPLPETGSSEIRSLAHALNSMAIEINRRIETISMQRSEQEAMFSSMKEGVIAVNTKEEILRLNPAAKHFFNIEEENPEKRLIHEVIRERELLDFIHEALKQTDYFVKEITNINHTLHILKLSAVPLHKADGTNMGTLILINDITRIKQLDRMRQEFVANVSHELKTPITSIKGYVETLREGAVQDVETRDRFLDIIARQSERLNAIIDDLLQLSKIEQRYGKLSIELQQKELLPVVRSAVSACQQKADDKHISIEVDCETKLSAVINPPLLEQALVNLLDNAIKYSNSDSTVRISAQSAEQHVRLSVQDQGCGIEAQYHNRLFERFFRVDKGRSREMGGTGLGLAIVKHIALAHQGRVYVTSAPGTGSTFTIELHKEALK